MVARLSIFKVNEILERSRAGRTRAASRPDADGLGDAGNGWDKQIRALEEQGGITRYFLVIATTANARLAQSQAALTSETVCRVVEQLDVPK